MDSDGEGRAGRRVGDEDGNGRPRELGVVTEQLPRSLYRVKLEAGGTMTAHIADRVDRNFVRVLVGDRVRVERSPVDAGRGRIVEKI